MNKPQSIKQNAHADSLPDFRNIGIVFRLLIITNGLAISQAALLAKKWEDIPEYLIQISTLFTPALLSVLLILWIIQPFLRRKPYGHAVFAVHCLAVLVTLAIYLFGGDLYFSAEQDDQALDMFRYALSAILATSITLMYFRLRARLLSHALNEARLQMLRARIRPHFFFNCINAVLGIVRAQPKKAETALEDMADLFRMAMSDAKDFVLLSQEISLCKQYIALEQLRMGDRLDVKWRLVNIPEDALIPPLLLQPLLENAVYHGIETLMEGGQIKVELAHTSNFLKLTVENPCTAPTHGSRHSGNKMALQNIRERLELLFDTEARYYVEGNADCYRVEITLPYLKEKSNDRS